LRILKWKYELAVITVTDITENNIYVVPEKNVKYRNQVKCDSVCISKYNNYGVNLCELLGYL